MPSHLRPEPIIKKIKGLFKPGSAHIPVQAGLNGKIQQKFVVDTGATLTTMPSAAARSLGFKSNQSYPTRKLYTASGTIEAPEIELSRIEVRRWVTDNVKALVVDLPQQPGIGLLGLNYRNRFRMNLNTDEGLLTLDPL